MNYALLSFQAMVSSFATMPNVEFHIMLHSGWSARFRLLCFGTDYLEVTHAEPEYPQSQSVLIRYDAIAMVRVEHMGK